MTELQECPLCHAIALRAVEGTRSVGADDGSELAFRDEFMECSACGDQHYTYEQAMASSRARAGALRQHAGLLTPTQIRAFREAQGLSQAELEALLQTGAKTVVRWEKGTVCQSRAADQLLRLLMLNPANFAALSGAAWIAASTSVQAAPHDSFFMTVAAGPAAGNMPMTLVNAGNQPILTDLTVAATGPVVPAAQPEAQAANAEYAQAA